MEYFIAIFVGVWISAAGILAYRQIKKDFSAITEKRKDEGK